MTSPHARHGVPTPIVAVATPTALTVAGSDSSGGAGLQADLRAFDAVGVHGASVVTLVTAQGTRGVRKVSPLPAELVRAQLAAVFEDMAPGAVKTGALGNAAVVEIVADALRRAPTVPLVLDPVIRPTLGRTLLDDSGFVTLVRELLPRAALVVPNRDEASRLAGMAIHTVEDARSACETILRLGAAAVLVKGGHFTGDEAIDVFFDGRHFIELRSPRLGVPAMHGLGCTLSALITARLARGDRLATAVRRAHGIVHHALAAPRQVGHGLALLGDLRRASDALDADFVETQ